MIQKIHEPRQQRLEEDPAGSSRWLVPLTPVSIQVTAEEREQIAQAVEVLSQTYRSLKSTEFRLRLPYLAGQHLPPRLYQQLAIFRSAFGRDDFGALILKCLIDVGQECLGPTPTRWQNVVAEKTTAYDWVAALIHGALAATPVEFLYQRKGGISHSLIPDPAMKKTQTGAGEERLGLHTEDPNLQHNADFITFLWLRNNEKVPCHLFSLRSLDQQSMEYQQILREPIFNCPADGNYSVESKQNRSGIAPVPVLYGNQQCPWMQVDFVEQLSLYSGQSQYAQEALEAFVQDVDRAIHSNFVPGSGDICVLNNKMCAHGRGAFEQGVSPQGRTVEKRWMLRMMSVVDRFAFYETADSEDPHFSRELPGGKAEAVAPSKQAASF